jgi:ankyrin repeat protein
MKHINGLYEQVYHAYESNDIKQLSDLVVALKADIDAKYDGETLFYKACRAGNISMIDHLIWDADANIKDDRHGETPLFPLCRLGETRFVKHILFRKAHADFFNASDQTPLHVVCQTEYKYETTTSHFDDTHSCMIRLLIRAGADVNTKDGEGKTPLHYACIKGYQYAVQTLIEEQADINAKDNSGMTPLQYACAYSEDTVSIDEEKLLGLSNREYFRYSIIDMLLRAGADTRSEDRYGRTALHIAVSHGCPDSVVKLLFTAGCLLNQQDDKGNTALFYAYGNNCCPSVIEYLILIGADKNIVNFTNCTVMHYAAMNQFDADLDNNAYQYLTPSMYITNTSGRTPLHQACMVGNHNMIDYILSNYKYYVDSDINAKDCLGNSALSYLPKRKPFFRDNIEKMRLLGADEPEMHETIE